MTDPHPPSPDWTAVLEGRGVDNLIAEHGSSQDAGRRNRLETFFEVCRPIEELPGPDDRIVKVARDEDLRVAERLTILARGWDKAFDLLDETVPEPDVQLLDLRNSTVLPDQTVFAEGLYLTDQVRHMSGNWLMSGDGYDLHRLHDLDLNTRYARLSLPEGVVHLPDDNVYFLLQAFVGSLSFGHFVIDVLTQLIVYDRLRLEYGEKLVPIVVNDFSKIFKWPGMYWLFERLFAPSSRVVHLRPGCRLEVAHCFTSNRLAHIGAGGISTRAFSYLRNVLFSRCTPSLFYAPIKRVYVSRRDAGYREADNISEAEKLLERHGFQTIVIQDLTPQEAFDALYGAEIIVGMHGSGLMYNLYTEKPATLIELSYPGFEWRIILACAVACGHDVIRVGYIDSGIDIETLEVTLTRITSGRDAPSNVQS